MLGSLLLQETDRQVVDGSSSESNILKICVIIYLQNDEAVTFSVRERFCLVGMSPMLYLKLMKMKDETFCVVSMTQSLLQRVFIQQ